MINIPIQTLFHLKAMLRGKREAVLPPMRNLEAYTTQKSFISLGGCDFGIKLTLFPSRKEKTTKFFQWF
jgi:hypothetical protein